MVMYELPTIKKSERLKYLNQEVSTFSAYSGSCAGVFCLCGFKGETRGVEIEGHAIGGILRLQNAGDRTRSTTKRHLG